MNKTVLTGIICFMAGAAVSAFVPRDRAPLPLEAKLTSQGRESLLALERRLNALNYADVLADQTRILQALSEKQPAVEQAEFYAAALREKQAELQSAAVRAEIEEIAKMPLPDREAYRAYRLKNRDALKRQMLLVPLLIQADLEQSGDRPRDKIFRKIGKLQ